MPYLKYSMHQKLIISRSTDIYLLGYILVQDMYIRIKEIIIAYVNILQRNGNLFPFNPHFLSL